MAAITIKSFMQFDAMVVLAGHWIFLVTIQIALEAVL